MSYDISLEINTGIKEAEVVNIGNMTYNVAPMYKQALGYSLMDLNDRLAGEVVNELRLGIEDMRNNPEKYEKLNPANGWGNYEGALKYLSKLYSACCEHPSCIIKVY